MSNGPNRVGDGAGSLELEIVEIGTRRGPRFVMVATPSERVVGAPELERLQAVPDGASETDEALIEAVVGADPSVSALLFSAGDGRWRFDATLPRSQLEALGYHLVRSQLELYRRLVAAGISLLFGAGLGDVEADLMRAGTNRLIVELEGREAGLTVPGARDANLWMLRHLCFFTSASATRVLEHGTLADQLPLCESRAHRARDLLAE